MNAARHPKIAITGRGMITALGVGIDENWRRLLAGQSGVKRIARFDTAGLRTRIAATVDAYDRGGAASSDVERTYLASREALQQAIAEAALLPAQRTGVPVFYGTTISEPDWKQRIALYRSCAVHGAAASLAGLKRGSAWRANALANESNCAHNGARLADAFGLDGPVTTLTTACASGGSAIQLAVDTIRRGDSARAIVVAADAAVCQENIARFSLLSALSAANDDPAAASRPFDAKRDGFVMGEGGAALILESEASARARGAEILGYVLGCGNATDNFHKTRSHPSGKYIVNSMKSALADAGVAPAQIDSINAHGTSTQENDKMESLGINLLFGEHAKNIHVTSNKSMIGHTLCAAGAIEALFSLQSTMAQVVPPTINLTHPDPAVQLNVVANTARAAKIGIVLSNSFGFGGQNVSLVIGGAH